jgi:hypothetical protein
MSLKWFCFKKEGLNPVIKIAAFDAGYLVEKNNKGFYAQARPVIDGILHADVSEDNAPIPMLPKEHIKDLVTSFAEGAKLVQ